MGKLRNGVFGPYVGKTGNLVGAEWNGINYVRTIGKNNKPRSEKQKVCQGRFADVNAIALLIKEEILDPIWKKAAQNNGMTVVNLFQRINYDAFNSTGGINDYSLLKMSVRDLRAKELPGRPQNLNATIDQSQEGHIMISWDYDHALGHIKDSDLLNIIIMDEEQVFHSDHLNIKREDRFASICAPKGNQPRLHLYVFFSDNTKTRYSESVYQFVDMSNEDFKN